MAFRTNKMPVLQNKSASGAIASFDTILTKPLEECTSLITGYQEGSGTPSPSNIRPLYAWSGANLFDTGKNLFDKNSSAMIFDGYLGGAYKVEIASGFKTVFIKCKPNTTYTVSKIPTKRFTIAYAYSYPEQDMPYYGAITQIDDTQTSLTLTTDSQAAYLLAYVYHPAVETASLSDILNSLQIEEGSEVTTYEPFSNTYTFTFGQDIYSGSIDWKRGVVVGNAIKFNDWENLSYYYNSVQSFYRVTISDMLPNNDSTRCNIYNYVEKTWISLVDYEFGISNNEIRFHNETITPSTTDFKNSLISQGVEIVYPLATPIEIPLGGINLLTQEGQNNIYCDTGDTSLVFNDLDIAKRGSFREVFKLPS